MQCDFAAMFAATVTVPSTCQYDWIARTGKHSIFSLLSKLAVQLYGSRRPIFLSDSTSTYFAVLCINLSRPAESSAISTGQSVYIPTCNSISYRWYIFRENVQGSPPEDGMSSVGMSSVYDFFDPLLHTR